MSRLLWVQFVDPTTLNSWQDLDSIQADTLDVIDAVGFFVHEDEEKLTIAMGEDGDYRLNLLHLPWGCVERVWELAPQTPVERRRRG